MSFNNKNRYILAVSLIIISVLAGVCATRDMDLINAWGGWAPPSYVWASQNMETFLKLDFLQEQNLHVGNSLAMRIYPLAYSFGGIDPGTTQYFFILATALLYAGSLWLLVSTLLPRVSVVVLWLVLGIALFTEAVNGNLARFGQANLSLGQAYGLAIPLQITALALAMRGGMLFLGAVLGLLFCVHLTLGAITTVIVAAMLCWKHIVWRDWRFGAAVGIVIVCAVGWAFLVVGVNANYPRMDTELWILWERLSNYHWFPFTLGVFTTEHAARLTPLLALAILACSCPAGEMKSQAVWGSWIRGLVASVFVTLIGLAISLYPFSQSLVMLSLHRASGVLLLLFLPIAIIYLVRCMERENVIAGSIAAMAIASPFLGTYGIPLFPSLALLFFKLYEHGDGRISVKQRWFLVFLSIISIAYVLFLLFAGYAHLKEAAFIGQSEAWLVGVVFFITKAILMFMGGKLKHYREDTVYAVIVVISLALLLQGVAKNLYSPSRVPQALAKSYMEAQKWARDNTPQNALFMPDPAHAYGWKDYSRRASFGNIRDWTHSVIVYRADDLKFKEGLRRAKLLGVAPEQYLALANKTAKMYPGCAAEERMYQDIRFAYYQMNGSKLIELAQKEGIDYFVFQLNYLNSLQLKPVYLNTHFVICEPILAKNQITTKISEQLFPITLQHSPSPLPPTEFIGSSGMAREWVNFGWRGEIMINGVKNQPGVMRLVAGEPGLELGESNRHCLLLKPAATGEQGLPIVANAQLVEFECELRSGKSVDAGILKLRLDVRTPSGWVYGNAVNSVLPGKHWSKYRVVLPVTAECLGITPILEWLPSDKGEIVEIRSPKLLWSHLDIR